MLLMPLIALLLAFLGLEQIFAAPASQPDTKTLYVVPCRTNVNGNWGRVRTARKLKSDQELLTLLSTEGVSNNTNGHSLGDIDLSDKPGDKGTRTYGICEGRDILAARDGTISQIGQMHANNGNYIVIQHDDGQVTWYVHMASLARLKKGDRVQAGSVIGVMGETGRAFGIHLHFSVNNTSTLTILF